MKLIRGMVLLLAVCLPTTWTLAHAEDMGAAGAPGDAKPKKKSKKPKKDAGGTAGAAGGEMK